MSEKRGARWERSCQRLTLTIEALRALLLVFPEVAAPSAVLRDDGDEKDISGDTVVCCEGECGRRRQFRFMFEGMEAVMATKDPSFGSSSTNETSDGEEQFSNGFEGLSIGRGDRGDVSLRAWMVSFRALEISEAWDPSKKVIVVVDLYPGDVDEKTGWRSCPDSRVRCNFAFATIARGEMSRT